MDRTIKDYAEIIKWVLKTQISYIEEEENYIDDDFLQGEVAGLWIALDKIEASKFLM